MPPWGDRPRISIITVCKNTGKFLEKCMESVFAQNYPDLEYIVQDSESTDETPRILEQLKRVHGDKLKIFVEKDSGIGDALNRALQKVTGDIVGIILSDERYRPGAFDWAVHAFSKHPQAAVIYGDYYSINDRYEITKLNRPGQASYEQILSSEKVIPCPSTFVQVKWFREAGFYADPHMKTCPDFEMWTRMGLRFPLYYEPGAVAENMVHEDSSTFQPASYKTFVNLKESVIERIMAAPATPEKIKNLRRRALAGLYQWAGDAVYHRQRSQAVTWYVKAFLMQPSSARLLRLLALPVPGPLVRSLQSRPFSERLYDSAVTFYRKYRKRQARIPNLEGDRDIEWSFVASFMPPGPGRAMDFGCGTSFMGLLAAQRGYQVTCCDLRPIKWDYVHPGLEFTQRDVLKMNLAENSLDLVINCSSVEHAGLSGRYGIEETREDGDLEVMKQFRSLLRPGGVMLLTVPVGKDSVFPPICRVYGVERLPKLLSGYEIEKEFYWLKGEDNLWRLSDREKALEFDSSMESWDAHQNSCALGCFVLKSPREEKR